MYSEDFRRTAVRLAESKPLVHVARELGIHPDTLRDWCRAAGSDGKPVEKVRVPGREAP